MQSIQNKILMKQFFVINDTNVSVMTTMLTINGQKFKDYVYILCKWQCK